MLKSEMHIHTNDDPHDTWIQHSFKDVVDLAAKDGFDVLSITLHEKYLFTQEMDDYAKSKGIVLIPGIEKSVEGKHTLIYNGGELSEKVDTLDELKAFKKENPQSLIVAAHPFFFMRTCHKSNVFKHYDLFDAWEYCHFHLGWLNPNNKLAKRKDKKPMVGNSDVHELHKWGLTYSLIDADKDIDSIIAAIKENKVKVITKAMKMRSMARIVGKVLIKKKNPRKLYA